MLVNNKLRSHNFYRNNISLSSLAEMLRPVRFHNNKAQYLLGAKKDFDAIYKIVVSKLISPQNKRDFLVHNYKGFGMKTASHFLRNMGDTSLAIIDTHILKFMDKPQYKNKKEYLIYEREFNDVAKLNGMSTMHLDALIWQRFSGTKWEDFKY